MPLGTVVSLNLLDSGHAGDVADELLRCVS
jgi:hypothetical protein